MISSIDFVYIEIARIPTTLNHQLLHRALQILRRGKMLACHSAILKLKDKQWAVQRKAAKDTAQGARQKNETHKSEL